MFQVYSWLLYAVAFKRLPHFLRSKQFKKISDFLFLHFILFSLMHVLISSHPLFQNIPSQYYILSFTYIFHTLEIEFLCSTARYAVYFLKNTLVTNRAVVYDRIVCTLYSFYVFFNFSLATTKLKLY